MSVVRLAPIALLMSSCVASQPYSYRPYPSAYQSHQSPCAWTGGCTANPTSECIDRLVQAGTLRTYDASRAVGCAIEALARVCDQGGREGLARLISGSTDLWYSGPSIVNVVSACPSADAILALDLTPFEHKNRVDLDFLVRNVGLGNRYPQIVDARGVGCDPREPREICLLANQVRWLEAAAQLHEPRAATEEALAKRREELASAGRRRIEEPAPDLNSKANWSGPAPGETSTTRESPSGTSKAIHVVKSGAHELADDATTRWIIFRDFKTIERTASLVFHGDSETTWETAAIAHTALDPSKLAAKSPKRFSTFKLAVALPPDGGQYMLVSVDREDATWVAKLFRADAPMSSLIQYLAPKAAVVRASDVPAGR